MVRWCIRLTRLTLVCEVIRYRLVQVRQNQKKTQVLHDFSAKRHDIPHTQTKNCKTCVEVFPEEMTLTK